VAGLVGVCGDHHSGPGSLDESARRLSHEELAAAAVLVSAGHQVRSLTERTGGPVPDLSACGIGVEVKSWLPGDVRSAPPTARSVANKLLAASRQADHVILVAGSSGLSPGAARAGMAEFAARCPGRLASVQVIGPGLDLGWCRSGAAAPEVGRARSCGREHGGPQLGI
jgi:hypothetical protein